MGYRHLGRSASDKKSRSQTQQGGEGNRGIRQARPLGHSRGKSPGRTLEHFRFRHTRLLAYARAFPVELPQANRSRQIERGR